MTNEAMSPLRRRMIEDMTIRKLAPKTQQGYIRTIRDFAAFLGRSPDTASFEDVRRFQLHLAANGAHVPILNHAVAALLFFFRVTLRHHRAHDVHPRAPQTAGRAQSGGGGAPAGCSARAQVQGGAERGLRPAARAPTTSPEHAACSTCRRHSPRPGIPTAPRPTSPSRSRTRARAAAAAWSSSRHSSAAPRRATVPRHPPP